MYKMVVSDFCKTLINSDEAISVSTMLEIDRIRKSNILFTITTSKSAKIVRDYNRDFPFIDYIVAFNGSYIYDVNKDLVLYDKPLALATIKKLYKLLWRKNLGFYTLDSCNYTGKYRDKDYSEMLIDVNGFIEENKKGIYKLSVYAESLKEAKVIVKKVCELELKISVYIVQEDDLFIVEITNAVNSKLDAVKKIAKVNKIKMKDILAVCSAESSCSLIENVGCGCSVANADKNVKKVANEFTDSNENKGVEHIIKKYF